MRFLIHFILILLSINPSVAQQNIYLLRNNDNGHLKKLKSKTVLTFKTSDSIEVTGRITSVSDSSFRILINKKHTNPDTITVLTSSVSQVVNKLINKPASVASIIGYIGIIGIVTSPFVLITDPAEDALALLEASTVLVAAGVVLHSPHLIKRKFDINEKWTLVVK